MLKKAGFKLTHELIAEGLLSEIDREPLKAKYEAGTIFIACSDCDRFKLYFDDLTSVISRAHTHALNGGAILIDPDLAEAHPQYPVLRAAHESLMGITGIEGDRGLKDGLHLVSLLSHFPCGMAGVLGMDLREVVRSTLKAKRLIKERFPGVKALALLSIDWRESVLEPDQVLGVKTYCMTVKDWDRFEAFFAAREALLLAEAA